MTDQNRPPENPTIAPEGEIPGMRRVLGSAQTGSPLDLQARELLARLSMDDDQDEAVRDRARAALAGKADFRDVLATPAFAQRMEAAGRALREALREMTDEQRDAVREAFLHGTPPDPSLGLNPKGDAGGR